jgi:hypothetical protein
VHYGWVIRKPTPKSYRVEHVGDYPTRIVKGPRPDGSPSIVVKPRTTRKASQDGELLEVIHGLTDGKVLARDTHGTLYLAVQVEL